MRNVVISPPILSNVQLLSQYVNHAQLVQPVQQPILIPDNKNDGTNDSGNLHGYLTEDEVK